MSRPGRALELVLGILDAGKIVAEQDARANDEPCLARKAGQPGGNFAIEIDTLPAAKRQIYESGKRTFLRFSTLKFRVLNCDSRERALVIPMMILTMNPHHLAASALRFTS